MLARARWGEAALCPDTLPLAAPLQARECLALAPPSTPAARQQLAAIEAAEALAALGVDLPPMQLQQLREAGGDARGRLLEQVRSVGRRPSVGARPLMTLCAAWTSSHRALALTCPPIPPPPLCSCWRVGPT